MDHPTAAPARRLRHGALCYGTPAEFSAGVLDFVAEGVACGEAVLVAATGPGTQALRTQLDGTTGHVTWADMTRSGSNPRRITAALRAFASEHRGQPLRWVQEPAWPAGPPGRLDEAIRHDALINLALAAAPASVLCAYDQRLGGEVLASVRRTHPLLLHGGQWHRNGSYLADVVIPADSERPLPAPPADAARLAYREDQAAVRQFAIEHASAAGLSPDRVTDLVIAVGELAANTLMHTRGPGMLAMWAAGGEILCQTHDGGQISDPLAGSFRPDPVAPGGGRGLWVVHQLSDLVEMRTGPAGTTIRLHMRLAPDAEPAPPGLPADATRP